MRTLSESEVRALAEAAGWQVPPEDLPALTVRLNGLLGLVQPLEHLPLDAAEPLPTLLTQRDG